MNENEIRQYLAQINRDIKGIEEKLQLQKDEFIEALQERSISMLVEFGIAKDAERITVIAGELRTLYRQKQVFTSIFNIKEGEL